MKGDPWLRSHGEIAESNHRGAQRGCRGPVMQRSRSSRASETRDRAPQKCPERPHRAGDVRSSLPTESCKGISNRAW